MIYSKLLSYIKWFNYIAIYKLLLVIKKVKWHSGQVNSILLLRALFIICTNIAGYDGKMMGRGLDQNDFFNIYFWLWACIRPSISWSILKTIPN
jgi:hypothetical protein